MADAWSTVVDTEVEWDDEQAGRMIALLIREDQKCPCGCGVMLEVSSDKRQPFATQPTICYARRALDVARRDYEQQQLPTDKRDKDWKPMTPQVMDGVMFSVAEHHPETPEAH